MQKIETLMTAKPDTPEGEKLDVLVTLVEAYGASAAITDCGVGWVSKA